MSHSKSSKKWLKEHFSDKYVKEAQQLGYRSRAACKLIDIQKSDHLIKPNMIIVDLGAAPGGWSQMAAKWLNHSGRIFALDILLMDPISGVEFIQGDFRGKHVFNALLSKLEGKGVDLVMSDMAPNISGIKAVDQAREMYLAELALDFACRVLVPNGDFLVKVFQGEDFDAYLKTLRSQFSRVVIRKPQSSRSRSRELYLLAFGRLKTDDRK